MQRFWKWRCVNKSAMSAGGEEIGLCNGSPEAAKVCPDLQPGHEDVAAQLHSRSLNMLCCHDWQVTEGISCLQQTIKVSFYEVHEFHWLATISILYTTREHCGPIRKQLEIFIFTGTSRLSLTCPRNDTSCIFLLLLLFWASWEELRSLTLVSGAWSQPVRSIGSCCDILKKRNWRK